MREPIRIQQCVWRAGLLLATPGLRWRYSIKSCLKVIIQLISEIPNWHAISTRHAWYEKSAFLRRRSVFISNLSSMSWRIFHSLAGQFISAVEEDSQGKEQIRAYSLASAANGNRFDLCLNRVEGGFFSNRLADLPDLPVGGTIQVYGPNGFFTLREPMTDSILIATGTGIAPMRSFAQWLFPQDGPDRSQGKQIWLVYGTRHESELYYRDEFEALAARHPNFHYLPTLSRGAGELDWIARICAGTCATDYRGARCEAGRTDRSAAA